MRQRGIFIQNTEKQQSVPIILSLLNSPKEFDYLKECQNLKEESPKNITRMLKWKSKASLIEAISSNLNINNIARDDYSNYKLIGSPNFRKIENNPNKIRLEYEVERTDNSKNCFSTKDRFKGSLEFEKILINNNVKLALTYSSAETKLVNQKIVNNLENHFKENGHVSKNSKITRILLSNFNNSQRVKFLWNLIGAVSDDKFCFANDISDIGFKPDDTIDYPSNIKWMEKRVNSLKLHGQDLHNTFFLSEEQYHQYFIFGNIDAKFDIDMDDIKGSCVVSFAFPGFLKNNNAEFEVDITNINLSENKRSWSRNHCKRLLLKLVEEHKIIEFENIFNKEKTI